MTVLIGSRIGSYEIAAKLGEGGMGEVWRARDTKLGRDVAIKVLPAAFTADPDRLARFEREAKLLAQLHHPNIASIFGLEESGPIRALVMELVEGPTLAERLEGGALPVDECLGIAAQIAAALEEAHEKGIVHRDLKPQNVKTPPGGRTKVLDFGLAKAMEPAGGNGQSAAAEATSASRFAASPTLTVGATQMGVILGTAAYMAPEQAKGMAVDRRADIWAFGVVLWEMLTGRRLFEAPTVPETLAHVLTREPSLEALPASTPPELRRLLRRCLERNPRNRLRDVGDARLVLEDLVAGRGDAATPARPAASGGWRRALPWIAAALGLLVGAAGWFGAGRGRGGAALPLTRLEIALPDGVEPTAGIAGGFAIAPDGRSVAMIGVRAGQRLLFVRRLERGEAEEVSGSAGVNSAAFSPDGTAIAFVPGSAQVVRLSLLDQQRRALAEGADLETTIGWGPSGIVFHRDGALWIVPPAGGEARRLTALDRERHEVSHTDPIEVPGSGRVLFTALARSGEPARIEAVALAGGARTVVVERASSPGWSATGHLLFERDGTLWAVALDARAAATVGPAVPVVRAGEIGALRFGNLGYRLSRDGTLLSMPPTFEEKRLVAVDRHGVERALDVPPGPWANPRVSPDGLQLLFEGQGGAVELLDLGRGTRSQLAPAVFGSNFPVWSFDGSRVVTRRYNLPHWIATDGSGRLDLIANVSINDYPTAPGPDPDSLLMVRIGAETGGDLYLLSLGGRHPPKPLVATPAYEGAPFLSPDRQWLVHQSNASGRPEIYVRRFAALDRTWQVSEGGGFQPRWSADGREIYYRSGRWVMAVAFRADGGGGDGAPRLGAPVALFADAYDFGKGLSVPNYDVGADGRFLMLRRTPAGGRLDVALGWNRELERLLATGGAR